MNQQRCDYVSVPSDKRTSISLSDKKRKKKSNKDSTENTAFVSEGENDVFHKKRKEGFTVSDSFLVIHPQLSLI